MAAMTAKVSMPPTTNIMVNKHATGSTCCLRLNLPPDLVAPALLSLTLCVHGSKPKAPVRKAYPRRGHNTAERYYRSLMYT
jgi:hypothetical protein